MLNRLVYFSERLPECDDAALEEIVALAAPRNRARDITGLLIADRRAFIQILEGPRTAVSLLFQDISRDARHRNVVLVEFTEI
ncbi:MAG: BLUF domain-containing protein, partial [Hyphomonadaceae bacterium]